MAGATRRGFLKGLGLAVAATVVAPKALAPLLLAQLPPAATVLEPVPPVYLARAFIPYTVEIGQDYPGFAVEVGRVLRLRHQRAIEQYFVHG